MSHLSVSLACPSRPAPSKAVGLRRIITALAVWRSRRTLSGLEAHMLEDIGITAAQAKAEANRPIWDVPAHWVE